MARSGRQAGRRDAPAGGGRAASRGATGRPGQPALAQRVRIIGGHWRRRMLSFPAAPDLRPTPDRIRETVFNWLGQDLHGLRCLDLFAGSGALGFEAASRGAARVVMVEQDPAAVHALQESLARLGEPPAGTRIELVRGDALRFLDRAGRDGEAGGFDVVFLDPPFRLGLLPALLPAVEACLAEGGWVYVEAPAALATPAAPAAPGASASSASSASGEGPGVLARLAEAAPWATIREARAGAVEYRMLARRADLQPAVQPAVQPAANPDSLCAGGDGPRG